MNSMSRLIQRITYPAQVANEDIMDTVKQYWDDVTQNYWTKVDDDLADELGVTPVALSELLEVNRHTFDYANLGGNSSVRGYDHGEDWFVVMFSDGSRYLYTLKSASREALDLMRKYAIEGKGLNSYIMRLQRFNYAGRNVKGEILIKPGMESFNPEGYKRLQLLKAFKNTMNTQISNEGFLGTPKKTFGIPNKNLDRDTLKKYRNQIDVAGPDGLTPVARQLMSVGIESMGIGTRTSLESFSGKDTTNETVTLATIIDGALQGSNESFWSSIKDFFAGRPKKIHLSGRDANLTSKLNSTINDRTWLSRQKYTQGEVNYNAIPGFNPQTAKQFVQQYISATDATTQFNNREIEKVTKRLQTVPDLFKLYSNYNLTDTTPIDAVIQDLNPLMLRFNIKLREPEITFGPLEPQTGAALTKIEVKHFAELVEKVFSTQRSFENSITIDNAISHKVQVEFRYRNKPHGDAILKQLAHVEQVYLTFITQINHELRQRISTHATWIGAENLADSLVNYIAKSITNVSSN